MLFRVQVQNMADISTRQRMMAELKRKPLQQHFEFWHKLITQLAVPFLVTYSNVPAIVQGVRRHDPALPRDRRFHLVEVACLVYLGRLDEAEERLEKHFGRSPAVRKDYGLVFEYIQALSWQGRSDSVKP
jgi:hypothetical protein